jgi:succinyl-CoA synthetase beta subunit
VSTPVAVVSWSRSEAKREAPNSMNIHEYQAADILSRHGIPVNGGEVATTPESAAEIANRFGGLVAIKAQVHSGGRGKAGGIKLARSADEARAATEAILGMDIRGHTVNKVLVVPGVEIDQEFYLGIVLDRPRRQLVMMGSAEGGVDIEEVARTAPEKIIRAQVDPLLGLHAYQTRALAFSMGIAADKVGGFATIAQALYEAYAAQDATLAEINPLILTKSGDWLALDSKMSFDDNALFRHGGIEALRDFAEENATELEARRFGISFVKLDGSIGCIVNGAGLAMATMDAVQLHGGSPANFLDVGGGASADQVAKAFGLVTSDPNVRAILINIFGGITRGDLVARGITEALGTVSVNVPIVVRLSGTNAEEGRTLLAQAGLRAVDTMDEAARQVVAAAA